MARARDRSCYRRRRRAFIKQAMAEKKLICYICNEDHLNFTPNNPREVTIDHVKPIAKGADPMDTSNWAICCRACNNIKGDL